MHLGDGILYGKSWGLGFGSGRKRFADWHVRKKVRFWVSVLEPAHE